MYTILVRDLDAQLVKRLKVIAKRHGRSLQGEIKAILSEATAFLATEAASISARWRKDLGGRKLKDSAELIREDRNR